MTENPAPVYADSRGRIRDVSSLQMICANGDDWRLPDPAELIPLPEESELFFLPQSVALAYNPQTGKLEKLDGQAVAAFAAPGYTLSAHPYYERTDGPLPLFAYGAVGFMAGSFWICAIQTDADPRQQFGDIPARRMSLQAGKLLRAYPKNRLVRHIVKDCAGKYGCPAAKNFVLGRYEAPLPTSRSCNASCLGCISLPQQGGAAAVTPQCRLNFIPDADEIVEVMRIHEKREKRSPIYSFGQGCEGDPLVNWRLLEESVRKFRSLRKFGAGHGTINCNSNASNPEAVEALAEAGLTSLRVSLNSAIPEIYQAYYRPSNYDFSHVERSIKAAASAGIFVSLNFLYFPGISDCASELNALAELCASSKVAMIQWRNLNIDPKWYWQKLRRIRRPEKSLGLARFMAELKKRCPWLKYGYFNPWLGDRAKLPFN